MIKKKLLIINIKQCDKVKAHFQQKLQLRQILKFFGNSFLKRHFYNLLKNVKTKVKLVSLFQIFYYRLDFFLTLVNFASSGKTARHLIRSGFILIQSYNGIKFKTSKKHFKSYIKFNDTIHLLPMKVKEFKLKIMKRLIPFHQLIPFWSKKSFVKKATSLFLIQNCFYLNFIYIKLRVKRICSFLKKESFAAGLSLFSFFEKWWVYIEMNLVELKKKIGSKYNKLYSLCYNLKYASLIWQFNKHRMSRILLKVKHKRYMIKLDSNFWFRYRYLEFINYNFSQFSVNLVQEPTSEMLYHFKRFNLESLENLI